jgi:hypothetical protein
MQLLQVKRSDPTYQKIRDAHYIPNHGCIGRQLHYLIEYEDRIVGIISGASAVWATKPRDEFFGITKDNRIQLVGHEIINNVVFRLEERVPNLGTQVLSAWRKRVIIDWKERYGDTVLGFETFIFGTNRNGRMYLADNWIHVGETAGNTKLKEHGAYGVTKRISTEKKLVFCKYVDGALNEKRRQEYQTRREQTSLQTDERVWDYPRRLSEDDDGAEWSMQNLF